ncbi:MAG: methionine adenosyltransferase [Hyphomicrobiaceae bacterium]
MTPANLTITRLPQSEGPVEIVERKGKGHPDTICDALAEELSRNLCRYYLDRFGTVLHHNVDKVLLRGGASSARFGGGEVTAPIEIYLAGRATTRVKSDQVPLEQIAIDGSRVWLENNLHALDAERDVRIHCLVRPGSADLKDVFSRSINSRVPLANDTSIGVGYAPASILEQVVMDAEQLLTDHRRPDVSRSWGEDVKIMGVTSPAETQFTVATAMIAKFLENAGEYETERNAISSAVSRVAASKGLENVNVAVNAADNLQTGSYYLTVTGTSAEAGDDGQVGRGNRGNGLITPYRPMTLEAAAGKNPVNHVGKLYGITAQQLAETIVSECPGVRAARCFLVSRIGKPITEPAFVDVHISTIDGSPVDNVEPSVRALTMTALQHVPELLNTIIDDRITVF